MSEDQAPYGKPGEIKTGPMESTAIHMLGGIPTNIGIVAGRIIVNFGQAVHFIGFDASTARQWAAMLRSYADDLDIKSEARRSA